jgi:hypothetical protein
VALINSIRPFIPFKALGGKVQDWIHYLNRQKWWNSREGRGCEKNSPQNENSMMFTCIKDMKKIVARGQPQQKKI